MYSFHDLCIFNNYFREQFLNKLFTITYSHSPHLKKKTFSIIMIASFIFCFFFESVFKKINFKL